eukprot:8026570-Karenia_brevis.AAC.1
MFGGSRSGEWLSPLQKMSLAWASVWETKVTIFHMFGGSRSGKRLSPPAENKLRVGLSMGSK